MICKFRFLNFLRGNHAVCPLVIYRHVTRQFVLKTCPIYNISDANTLVHVETLLAEKSYHRHLYGYQGHSCKDNLGIHTSISSLYY